MTTNYSQESANQLVRFQAEMIKKLQGEVDSLKQELNACYSQIQHGFQEGDDYWTLEDGKVVHSCWDDVSEELHNQNPTRVYFLSEEDAYKFLKS